MHLIFHPDNFERLTAISRHPVISQHVTYLFYESDALAVCESQQKWSAGVLERDLPVEMPAKPNRGASERDYRAYYRACLKSAQDYRYCQLRSEQRDRGYLEYQRLFAA